MKNQPQPEPTPVLLKLQAEHLCDLLSTFGEISPFPLLVNVNVLIVRIFGIKTMVEWRFFMQ